jgi:protein AaeX
VISEVNLGGVFVAPIVIYGVVAALIFVVLRFVLARTGILQQVWHPALFEVAMFLSIVSLLVRYF